jgi:hypothetical protein
MKHLITHHDKYHPAMSITDPAQAAQYFEECVQHNMDHSANTRAQAEAIERANLGYWAGYYSRETRLRVEELFDCQHPILGKAKDKAWTPEELVHKGMEIAREYTKRSGHAPDHASNKSVKG